MKSRLIRMVSLWDIIIASFISWIIKSFLNLFVKVGKKKLRFEGKSHLYDWYWFILSPMYIRFYLGWVISFNEKDIKPPLPLLFDRIVKVVLEMHRRMHMYGILKGKPCEYCQLILENKNFLQGFTSESKLYPPFRFKKKTASV